MCRRFLLPAFVIAALSVPIAAHAQTTDKDAPAVALKRRSELTAENLRKQLQFVQELGLDQGAAVRCSPAEPPRSTSSVNEQSQSKGRTWFRDCMRTSFLA